MGANEQAYSAYQAGTMGPEQLEQYKSFLKTGALSLPEGVSSLEREQGPDMSMENAGAFHSTELIEGLEAGGPEDIDLGSRIEGAETEKTISGIDEAGEPIITEKFKPVELPNQIWEVYKSGDMGKAKKAEMDRLIFAGNIVVPDGMLDEPGWFESAYNVITGDDKKVKATEKMDDWWEAPELDRVDWPAEKFKMLTMFKSPSETAETFKKNFPKSEVRQDEKGNYIFKSGEDGIERSMKPGIDVNDSRKFVQAMIAYLGAGKAKTIPGGVLGTAATQLGIESLETVLGGFSEFDARKIPKAALVEAGTRGAFKIAGVANEARKAAKIAKKAEKTAGMVKTSGDLAEVVRKAPKSKEHLRILAEESKPDQKTLAAAERLGVTEYLQPDHVSTSQPYREVAQAVKSQTGSVTREAELKGLEQIAKKADDLINDFGGSRDLSTLDYSVKQRVGETVKELEKKAKGLYDYIDDTVPPKTDAPASQTLAFLDDQADVMQGVKNLTKEEKLIVDRLTPKVKQVEGLEDEIIQPTYALLDKTRKEIGAALNNKGGPFQDGDKGKLKKLFGLLTEDQGNVLASIDDDLADTWKIAKASVKTRKAFEADLTAIYGKHLEKSIVGPLSASMKKLPKGDVDTFIKLMKAVPEDMREEVTASGLATAFGVTAKRGGLSPSSYTHWYEGLLKNKRAYNAIMTNLPKDARKGLSDLYRVSRGISRSTKEFSKTGKSLQLQIQGADNLLKDVFKTARKAAIYTAVRQITKPAKMVGEGVAMGTASILTRGKGNALRAADRLMGSPEFVYMAKNIGTESQEKAVKLLAKSKTMKDYMRAVGEPTKPGKIELWIKTSIQADRQLGDEATPEAEEPINNEEKISNYASNEISKFQ